MRILVIDDKPENLEAAKQAVEAKGWDCVTCNPTIRDERGNIPWLSMMATSDGVITDLMWAHANHGEKPLGLMVVIHALSLGKAVVICTNARDHAKGHHGEAIGFIHDGYTSSVYPGPFGWVEDKSWTKATELLEPRLK